MRTQEPGAEIAGYRIESVIGRGGMAVVYRAEDMRLGRKVALKLLTPQLVDNEQFRQRFIMESRLAASLDHPNIVPIYEAGEADEQLFIAMRYVLGSDMKGLLAEEGGPLPEGRTLRLLRQIGDALDSAHRAGLVHRDVKPANILVAAGPEHRPQAHGDHVYLTDFGLTKRTSELSGGLTGTGHFLGTVDYVSPEQIQGKPVGPRTDIYALGCVLYECLTGQLPFRRDDDAALLWAHLVEMPPPITGIRPEIGGAVNAVVARAMAKDPADRYESCQELVRELDVALGMPAPVSWPGGRHARESGEVTRRSDPTWDVPRGPPGTGTGDVPGGSQHPSFPSRPFVPLPAPAEASSRTAPPADHDPDLQEPPGPDRGDDARSDWDRGSDWDQGDDARSDWDQGSDWDRGSDWDQGDDGGSDWDQGESVVPPATPTWKRHGKLVALVAAAAVLVAVAAVLVRSSLQSEDYRTYSSTNGETLVPFRLDHPASWGTVVGPASDVVLGPDPSAAAQLFFTRTPQAWAGTTGTVRSGSSDAVWLYVYTLAATFDTSDADTLRGSMAPFLPTTTQFEPALREVTVAGAPADEMEAVASDPADPRTRLQVLVDVVQPASGGTVLLAFFAPPDTFESNRPTYQRIRDSLRIGP
jgi:serine/threonine protein kinase